MRKATRLRRWFTTVGLVAVGLALALLVPAVHAQAGSPVAPPRDQFRLLVDPPAASPGDPMTYTLTLENPRVEDSRVTVEVSLPAGFDLGLDALPAGASYNLRSRTLSWMGVVPSGSSRLLALPGRAPADPLPDGRLTAHAAIADETQVIHLSAEGWAGVAPSAGITYSVQADSSIQFSSESEGTEPLGFWWDFGDGTFSTAAVPGHLYSAGGEFHVRLTVANPKGADAAVLTITAPVPPPRDAQPGVHQFLVSDETPAVGQPVYFGSDSDPATVSVRWNFGDGATSGERDPAHSFQFPGFYTVARILGEGETAVQSSQILVVDHAPEASIQSSGSAVSVGELITLTASTSAAAVSDYYWDFGDGGTAGHREVAHSYGAPGDYLVTLAIGNDFGVGLDTLSIRVYPYFVYLPWLANGATPQLAAETESAAPAEPGATAEPQPGAEPVPAANLPVDPLAQQMLAAINAERQVENLPPLSWSDELGRSAQHHSDDMAAYGFTGHYGSNGSRPADRLRQASYSGDYAGEVTAWGFDDLASAVAWWMTSPPHRVIILSTVATDLGGGYSYNPGAPSVHYWTIDFGAR